MLITADQIRAARALKNWSQTDLAERTGLAVPTIANIELGKQTPGKSTIEKIVTTFSASGIAFLEDEGVQKVKSQLTAYRGKKGFLDFIASVDQMAQELNTGDFCISNINEKEFDKWEDQDSLSKHKENILKTKIKYKILTAEGDLYVTETPYTEYRWTPKEAFSSVPVYIYGDKVAIIGFEKDDVNVYVIHDEFISKLYKKQFNEMWDRSKKIPKDLKSDKKKGRK